MPVKKLTPILNPMGINDDNWPATVGLITGTLAKEVVVGTLNTIYTQGEDNVIPDKFSLIDSVKESWNTTIDNIKGIDLATLMNPIEASKADANMDNGAMGNMVTKFGSLSAAFAYLLLCFIIYTLYFCGWSNGKRINTRLGNFVSSLECFYRLCSCCCYLPITQYC